MSKLFRHRLKILLLTAGLLSIHAFADAPRVGVVNSRRVLVESNAAKAALKKFEMDFAPHRAEIDAQEVTLKNMTEAFEKMAPTFTDTERLERQRQLANFNRDFLRHQRQLKEDRDNRKREDIDQIMQLATKAVKEVALSEKYDLVLQDVQYANSANDITDGVIKAMNNLAQQ